MSKASRRSSRTTRGAAGRPTGSGPTSGGPSSGSARPAASSGTTPPGASGPSGESGPPTVDAAALPNRASATRPAGSRPAGSRPGGTRPGSRPGSSSRPRRTLYQPSFFDRHKTAILGGGLVAVVAVLGAFFFFNATAAAYSCATITQPQPSGTPLPNGSPAPLGQAQPDMGNLHITVGSPHQYSYCPPASGPHYNNPGIDGPITAKFYGPDDGTKPEGWIHNLEHGAVVILYNCKLGACDSATQTALQAIPVGFPDSPVCGIKAGVLAPVVARFDDMPSEFAALVWDRVLYMSTLDVNEIKTFYATEGELTNPEPQCARPSPSPSVAPSVAPIASPSNPASDQVPPAPSSAPSTSPSPSSSPAASPAAS